MAAIDGKDVLRIIFLIVLILLSFGSNFVVILAVLTYKKLRNAFNNIVVSLAVADLLVGVFVIPFYLTFLVQKTLHKQGGYFYLYAVYLCFDIFTGIASIMNITLMSIDRALMLFSPRLHSRTLGNRSFITKAISLPWIVAIIMIIPKILQYHSMLAHTNVVLVYFLFVFILPFVTITVCYIYIFVKHAEIRRQQSAELKRDMNLAYMTLVIVVMFFVCWGPFFGIMLYYSHCKPCKNLSGLAVFSKWMQFFHSCCNPFIYALLQPSLRKAFVRVLCRCMPCRGKERVIVNQEELTVEELPMNEATVDEL